MGHLNVQFPDLGRNKKHMKEPDHIELVSSTVQPGNEIIVGRSFREILNGGRRRA